MKKPERMWIVLLALCMLPLLANRVFAEDNQATEISGHDLVQGSSGFNGTDYLFDQKIYYGKPTPDTAAVTLGHPEGIGSLYFIFDETDTAFSVTDEDSGETRQVEGEPFYHRFLDLTVLFGKTPHTITLNFDGPVSINEIYAFTEGQVPDWVQRWKMPAEGCADLVLFSTHGDDEQLFFCGILPYYAGELGYKVQVVYLTDHREKDPNRIHEMLNGLWNVGVRYYPVTRPYPDFILRYDLQGTYDGYLSYGITKEELVDYVVEQIRRFRPTVVIGHDIQGEYGHGMHMMYTDVLREALTVSNDPTYHQDSAETYGLWDVPKTYLHLYEENPIVMDWDIPLENFGGMTAYQVSKEIGYPSHVSQYVDFYWYYADYATAAELPKYNPCYYGLYRSTVGEDLEKNDFFENVICHTEQARLDAIRQQQEEEARKRAEEEERAREEEARRKATEEAEAQAELEREQQRLAAEAEAQRQRRWKAAAVGGGILAAALIVIGTVIAVCRQKAKNQKNFWKD